MVRPARTGPASAAEEKKTETKEGKNDDKPAPAARAGEKTESKEFVATPQPEAKDVSAAATAVSPLSLLTASTVLLVSVGALL